MNARWLSKLDYPYREMLQSLRDVKGADEFIKFIGPRVHKDDAWKAEVCGLFEINKTRHPLIEICSQQSSTPEGIFKVSDRLGIIEAAKIGYLFDTSYENRKRINKIVNCFKPIVNLLTGQYSAHNIRIEVDNTDVTISDTELKDARNVLAQLLREGRTLPISVNVGFGRMAVRQGQTIDVTAPDIDLLIGITHGGIVTQAYNADLNKKIGRVLKSKRVQHKTKYDEYLKLYYFLVDCPAPRLLEVDLNRIFRQLDDSEIVYVGTVFGSNQHGRARLMKSRIIIPGKGLDPNHFDFLNEYFQDCPFPDPKRIKRIF
jgi:hypothetical protein